jgi:hypothetical protein
MYQRMTKRVMCWFLCVCFVACCRKRSEVNLFVTRLFMEMCDSEDCHHHLIHHSLCLSHGPREEKSFVCVSRLSVWVVFVLHAVQRRTSCSHLSCPRSEDILCIAGLSPVYWSSLVFQHSSVFTVPKCLQTCVEVVSVVSSHSELWAHLFVCFVFWPQCSVLLGCNQLFFVIMCHWSYMSSSVSGPSASLAILAVFSCCCFEFEILSSEVCVWTAVPGLTQVQEQQTEKWFPFT